MSINNLRVCLAPAFAILLLLCSASSSFGQSVETHWSEDGTRFWYQKSGEQGQPIFQVVDVASRSGRPAFDQAKVLSAISERLGQDNPLINRIAFAETPGQLFLQAGGKYFQLEVSSSKIREVEKPEQFTNQDSRLFLPPRSSGASNDSTNITVENRTDESITMVWISRSGEETAYGSIEPGNKLNQHTYAGHIWLLQAESGKRLGCFEARVNDFVVVDDQAIENVRRNRRSSRRRPRNRRPEATGPPMVEPKWNAVVRDHNLWVTPRGDSSAGEVQLTRDATEENSFERFGSGTRWFGQRANQAELGSTRWSPDGQYLIAWQTRKVDEPRVYYVESTPGNQLQPILRSYQYPKPGDDLPTNRLRLFSVAKKKEIEVSNELFDNPFSLQFRSWSEKGDRFYLLYNQRGHQVLRLLEVTLATGKVRAIIEEKSDTFIQYSDSGKFVLQDLPDGEILWASERSGWNHLYRFDREEGKLINAVTSGDWNVKRIHRVDRENGRIWFYAVGIHKDQDPYHEHFCRVNFDGSGLVVLTDGDGTHRVSFQQNEKYLIDTYSRVDMAPVVEMRDAATGERITELSRGNTRKQFGDRKLTTRFVAKGRDGETDIWGIIHWPIDFDPNATYPVVENIYAGPHDHHVPKSFRTRYYHQHQIADAGMIVVQIDGMGTAWRSRAFHDVCHKNLRDAGFPDRIAWIKAAAEKFPQMDITRVGIYGGSAGGQNSMAALLWHNDFYDVAVADCGCHDNRMDKIWWNEQWMGWPVEDHYIKNSNMENAHLLKGQLMLTLGELDRNVDPASTTQVVRKLIENDKDFEFVLVAGAGHGAGEVPWAARKRLNFLKRHLGVE